MWADTKECFSAVAVPTQYLDYGRIALFLQPTWQQRSRNNFPMLGSIVVYVVKHKKLPSRFATTNTASSISCKCFFLKCSACRYTFRAVVAGKLQNLVWVLCRPFSRPSKTSRSEFWVRRITFPAISRRVAWRVLRQCGLSINRTSAHCQGLTFCEFG